MAKKVSKTTAIAEFGDFQTPDLLANQVCETIAKLGIKPGSIVEPTCGKGSILLAAAGRFITAEKLLGVELNSEYIAIAQSEANQQGFTDQVELRCESFFSIRWAEFQTRCLQPISESF